MNEIYCSTGVYIGIPNNRDYRLIPPNARKIHCDGLEFMLYNSWYDTLDDVLGLLLDSGIAYPVLHVEKSVTDQLGDEDRALQEEAMGCFQENCRAARALGAFMVLHLWNGNSQPTQIDRLIEDALPRLRGIAGDFGVELTLENIPSVHGSPLQYLERVERLYPGQRFTVDVRHTNFQGEADAVRAAAWLWDNNLVRHVHISDFEGASMDFQALRRIRMPGQGSVDFERWFSFLRDIGYQGSFTLESNSHGPEGIADVAAVDGALEFIRRGMEGAV